MDNREVTLRRPTLTTRAVVVAIPKGMTRIKARAGHDALLLLYIIIL